MTDPPITQLLRRYEEGDQEAFRQLLPAVYEELHGIALKKVGPQSGQTLSPTVLVHEAYLKLFSAGNPIRLEDRPHFLAVAARAMRHVLVDQARARTAQKRGGNQPFITLNTSAHGHEAKSEEVLRLDRALEELATKDPVLFQIVELRFFGGLQQSEIAEIIGKSERTVKREWAVARAWLARELRADEAGPR